METQTVETKKPEVTTRQKLAEELNLGNNDLTYVDVDPKEKSLFDIDPKIAEQVKPEVDKFFKILMDKEKDSSEKTDAVYSLGRKSAERKNEFLERQMRELMGKDGNQELAEGLLGLRDQIADLDPRLYFSEDSMRGILNNILRKMFGDNKFVQKLRLKYINKYETSEGVIKDIIQGLQAGQGTLERNNIVLADEKKLMRADVEQLKKAIAFGQMLDERIEKAIGEAQDAEWKQILSEEILFPLRQRINTLQKTRVVKNQSILTYEMIMRTNRQLINGIKNSDQAIEILKIAITTELSLRDAKKVNDAINAMDKLSGDMLVANSEKLKTVVMEVYKTAARAGIPIEKLVTAQRNALATLESYSNFIQEQLPKMKEEAAQVEQLNKEVQAANDKMERGSKIGAKIAESMSDLF